jgi:CRP/FNR family transcriptional regulator, nitrogen oxide reductase regulator
MIDIGNFNSEDFESIPLFTGLNKQELGTIIREAGRKQRAEGEFFFLQGEPADSMYVLTSGRVRLFQTSEQGDQILIHIITPVRLFALVAMTQVQRYPVSAQAAGKSEAIFWRREQLMDFVIQYPVMAVNAMRIMAEQIKEMQDRLRHIATERVERRLARALVRLGSEFGTKVDEGILIDIPLTQQELAEMCGTTLYTVSRILNQWENVGYVVCSRERVIIRFPHGLVQMIEGP